MEEGKEHSWEKLLTAFAAARACSESGLARALSLVTML
jgi:hypothetical protein